MPFLDILRRMTATGRVGIGDAFQKVYARYGRQLLQFIHGEYQRPLHHAVDHEAVRAGVDIRRSGIASKNIVESRWSDDAGRILERRIGARSAGAGARPEGCFITRPFAVSAQILRVVLCGSRSRLLAGYLTHPADRQATQKSRFFFRNFLLRELTDFIGTLPTRIALCRSWSNPGHFLSFRHLPPEYRRTKTPLPPVDGILSSAALRVKDQFAINGPFHPLYEGSTPASLHWALSS